jgi:hypothetical protein
MPLPSPGRAALARIETNFRDILAASNGFDAFL